MNALSDMKRPICNFCGMVCSFLWYMKPPKTSQDILEKQIKDKDDGSKQPASLHDTLRELTQSYVLCKECFDLGNFPKVFKPEDFQATTLRSILGDETKDDTKAEDQQARESSFMAVDDEMVNQAPQFTTEEKSSLIEAVTQQSPDCIDWSSISREAFKGKYTPNECVFEFLRLPISESLSLKLEGGSLENASTQDGS